MATLTAAALAVMQRQAGHITSTQLTASGVSRETRRGLVAAGVLERASKSVYRVAKLPITFERRLITISLGHPAGFITSITAGQYLALRKLPRASAIHLCVPHGSRTDVESGVRLRQSTQITSLDRRVLDNGMIVASWPRLVFDLASDVPASSLRSVIEQVLQREDCTFDDLGAIARRLCHPLRPGSVPFARALMERGDRAPVDSDPELVVLEGLLARGVPVEPQHRLLRLPNGKSIRIDLAVPAVRWAVELDLHPGHFEMMRSTSDHQRTRQLHLIDWQVEHVTPIDMLDLVGILDELAELYRARVISRAA